VLFRSISSSKDNAKLINIIYFVSSFVGKGAVLSSILKHTYDTLNRLSAGEN
jgi:hypothetical protein